MPTIYDSYPPDKRDLADKEPISRVRSRPRKTKVETPSSEYMDTRPLEHRPFEKLFNNWR